MRQTAFLAIGAMILVVFLAGCSKRSPGEQRHRFNVLLISIDTCRADALSCYGHPRQTTPQIDALAQEGYLFENVLSPVPLTLPSHASMLTGTIPPFHGVHDNANYRLGESNVTLAEILREHGYRTAAFVGSSVLDFQYGLAQGFDLYDDRFRKAKRGLDSSERQAEEVSQLACDWLRESTDEPFFLFLHFYDPHATYEPPQPFAKTFANDLYAGEVAYTDHCIGWVIETLKKTKHLDSTLIVVTGDHGEALGEHGESTHGYFVYQSTQRVPLVFRLPGGGARGMRVQQWAALVDIVPTILGYLGLPIPVAVHGEDLSGHFRAAAITANDDRPIYIQSLTPTKYLCNPLLAIVSEGWKYIHTSRPELYDLSSDPRELVNRIQDAPDRGRRMERQLKKTLAEQGRLDSTDSQYIPDQEMVRRLEALGYVAGRAVRETFELDPQKDDPKDSISLHESVQQALIDLARERFEQAKVAFARALAEQPALLEMHERLGQLALTQGDLDTAIHHYTEYLKQVSSASPEQEVTGAGASQTLSLKPNLAKAHLNLGTCLASRGRMSEALTEFELAVEADPGFPDAHYNLAHTLARMGKAAEAIGHYQKALELKPDWDICASNLAWLLATTPDDHLRNASEAVRLAELATRLSGGSHPIYLNTLAAAYAEAGRFPEAVRAARQAIQLAQQSGNESYAGKIRLRLQFYEAGQPVREP